MRPSRSPSAALVGALVLLVLCASGPVARGESRSAAPTPQEEVQDTRSGWMDRVDGWMKTVNDTLGAFIFWPIPVPGVSVKDAKTGETLMQDRETGAEVQRDPESGGFLLTDPETGAVRRLAVEQVEPKPVGVPLAVAILVLGAIFFTLRMGIIQFRAFAHAAQVTSGKYDNPEDEGEVSHFQALSAALSATVGLGNIGGVAIAVGTGGPGATFWMICAGLFGMASKFTECTLGQMYREVRPDGRVMGGAMFYLSKGLKELGIGWLGKFMAVFFAVTCIGASFGGGNTFQVSQSLGAIKRTVPFLDSVPWVYGLVLAGLVAIVILGGLRRIALTAERIVPLMCTIYVLAAVYVIVSEFEAVPGAVRAIVSGAFTLKAGMGGFLGVLVIGFQRAAFSNEAGIGSAAIAHSAARTPYPIREGIVALLEPFIDTVVVCTMTALVIVITGTYSGEAFETLHAGAADMAAVKDVAAKVEGFTSANDGAALTSLAMSQVLPWFPYVLSAAVLLFAFSTMISWSYYGERCWAYLFGDRSSLVYRVIFIVFVFLGSVITATNVLNFGDLLIFGMVFPNIFGVLLLSGKVRKRLDDYWTKYQNGEFPTYR